MKPSDKPCCNWIMRTGEHAGETCRRNAGKGRDFCSYHWPAMLNMIDNDKEELPLVVKIGQGLDEANARPTGSIGKIINFENEDKGFHEKWYPGRSWMNIPHPSRMVVTGRPNVGKGVLVKNLVVQAQPEYEKIFVWSVSPENTKEFDDMTESEYIVDKLPTIEELNNGEKTLLIIDDVDCFGLDRATKSRLDRVFGFVSTHCNVSVIITAQDPFRIPKSVRANCNVFVMFKICDEDSMNTIARRLGMTKEKLRTAFKCLTAQYDSITIDMTGNSPCEIRKNIFEPVYV
jgi:hypothetical protein